jgi:hypothetical protein
MPRTCKRCGKTGESEILTITELIKGIIVTGVNIISQKVRFFSKERNQYYFKCMECDQYHYICPYCRNAVRGELKSSGSEAACDKCGRIFIGIIVAMVLMTDQ